MKRARKKKGRRVEVKRGRSGSWHWRLVSGNNRIETSSQNYSGLSSKSHAMHAARRIAAREKLSDPLVIDWNQTEPQPEPLILFPQYSQSETHA